VYACACTCALVRIHILQTPPHLPTSFHPPRALKESSELKVEAQQLAVAYDQLMKLTKLIDAFTELNFKAMAKIIKKHDKVGMSFRHTKKALDEFLKMQAAAPDGDVNVTALSHMFEKTFGIQSQGYMQKVLGVKIEEDYVRLHEELLHCQRDKALGQLRLRGDIVDPPMKQTDTFTLGCLVGCMIPLFSYAVIVVMAGHNVTSSPQWPFVWVHFRMVFLSILHASLWAWNIYVFKTFKINYCLIFDISPGSQLHYNTLLKLCAGALLWVMLWLTVSLQNIINQSHIGDRISYFEWISALDQCVRSSSSSSTCHAACIHSRRITPFACM